MSGMPYETKARGAVQTMSVRAHGTQHEAGPHNMRCVREAGDTARVLVSNRTYRCAAVLPHRRALSCLFQKLMVIGELFQTAKKKKYLLVGVQVRVDQTFPNVL